MGVREVVIMLKGTVTPMSLISSGCGQTGLARPSRMVMEHPWVGKIGTRALPMSGDS